MKEEDIPIVFDLDGTIVADDSIMHATIAAVRKRPVLLIFIIFWICRGKVFFKNKLMQNITINPEDFVFREDVLEYAKTAKAAGRKLILATATAYKIAEKFAEYLDIFDEVWASNDKINLRAKVKNNLLVEKYGCQGFDYVGDSPADLKVWKSARRAILVYPNWWTKFLAEKNNNVNSVFHIKCKYVLLYILNLVINDLGLLSIISLCALDLLSNSRNYLYVLYSIGLMFSYNILSLFVNKDNFNKELRIIIYNFSGNYLLKLSLVIIIIVNLLALMKFSLYNNISLFAINLLAIINIINYKHTVLRLCLDLLICVLILFIAKF